MKAVPKISIIVRVRNQHELIGYALDSILAQTLSEIEVICIDNCSSDGTVDIIQEYAKRDSRLHLILNQEDMGLLKSDILGLQAAEGRYVTFVDADDIIPLDACERMYTAAEGCGADIVQFPVEVRASENAGKEIVEITSNYLKPYPEPLYGEEIPKKSVLERKYAWNLLGKLFRNEICKLAIKRIEAPYLIYADDMLLYTCVAHFARIYIGKMDMQPCYVYYIGTGGSTSAAMSLEEFKQTCSVLRAKDVLVLFFSNLKILEEQMDYCTQIPQNLMHDILYIWLHKVDYTQQREAFAFLCKKAPPELIAGSILELRYIQEDLQIAIQKKDEQLIQKNAELIECDGQLRSIEETVEGFEKQAVEQEKELIAQAELLEKQKKELADQAKMVEAQEEELIVQMSELKERKVLICHQNELLCHYRERETEILYRVKKLNEHLQEPRIKRAFKIESIVAKFYQVSIIKKIKMAFSLFLHICGLRKTVFDTGMYEETESCVAAIIKLVQQSQEK